MSDDGCCGADSGGYEEAVLPSEYKQERMPQLPVFNLEDFLDDCVYRNDRLARRAAVKAVRQKEYRGHDHEVLRFLIDAHHYMQDPNVALYMGKAFLEAKRPDEKLKVLSHPAYHKESEYARQLGMEFVGAGQSNAQLFGSVAQAYHTRGLGDLRDHHLDLAIESLGQDVDDYIHFAQIEAAHNYEKISQRVVPLLVNLAQDLALWSPAYPRIGKIAARMTAKALMRAPICGNKSKLANAVRIATSIGYGAGSREHFEADNFADLILDKVA